MSDYDEYGRREPDYDEVRDAYLERKRESWRNRCQCGDDLPGRCPGPANCPMVGPEDCDDCDETDNN